VKRYGSGPLEKMLNPKAPKAAPSVGTASTVSTASTASTASKLSKTSKMSRSSKTDQSKDRSEHRPPQKSSKSRDDELSQSQHCPSRSTASKTRVHRQGRCSSMDNCTQPDILEGEFKVNASQILEFQKQGEEEEDAFGTMFVASATPYFRKSLENSSSHRKDNPANYEYEEPEDSMTFGKQERGPNHDDLGPRRSHRTPRRNSMGVFPSSAPSTETYSADSSVFAAPVDAHHSSTKSRRRARMASSSSIVERNYEKQKSEVKISPRKKRSTLSKSSNLNTSLKNQTELAPKASESRSVCPSFTEARKNSTAKYEYEEHGDMMFGKQERGPNHDDLGPKRSGRRTPRRCSMGVLPSSASAETYSADSSVFASPVDAHQSSTKSRRRANMASSSSIVERNYEKQKSEVTISPRKKRSTLSKSSNLNASLKIQTEFAPKAPGSRSVCTRVTEARKNAAAKYEYEEPGDMTFGKQERGQNHDHLGPKRSGRGVPADKGVLPGGRGGPCRGGPGRGRRGPPPKAKGITALHSRIAQFSNSNADPPIP
jgi:hypothetical protein